MTIQDLTSLFGGGSSQWEAVACDGDGRVLVLSETNSAISVLDPTLSAIAARFDLVVLPHHPLGEALVEVCAAG